MMRTLLRRQVLAAVYKKLGVYLVILKRMSRMQALHNLGLAR